MGWAVIAGSEFEAIIDHADLEYGYDVVNQLTDHELARQFSFPPAGTRSGPRRYYTKGVFS